MYHADSYLIIYIYISIYIGPYWLISKISPSQTVRYVSFEPAWLAHIYHNAVHFTFFAPVTYLPFQSIQQLIDKRLLRTDFVFGIRYWLVQLACVFVCVCLFVWLRVILISSIDIQTWAQIHDCTYNRCLATGRQVKVPAGHDYRRRGRCCA